LAAEALGTFFLVLIGPGAAMVDARTHGTLGVAGVALAFAFVVVAMVTALCDISGAHINPAVTVALWSIRRFPGGDVAPYVVAQCAGAAAASVVSGFVLGPVGHFGATLPSISIGGALGVEFLLSFALMFVIMAVVTGSRVPSTLGPITIGLTVGFCALVAGPLTGASMNPARSFGPAFAGGEWRAHWVYWVAPIAGMLAAARVYGLLGDSSVADPAARSLGMEGPVEGRDVRRRPRCGTLVSDVLGDDQDV
jgi:MIP family channel proteins